MPLVALLIVSIACGLAVAIGALRLPHVRRPSAPAGLRRSARLDPEVATGLALTLALVVLVAGGLVLAVLAFVVHDADGGIGLDTSAADWGARHATAFTTDVLEALTHLGQPRVVAGLAVVLAVVETVRTRSRWVVPFLLLVVAGNGIVTTTIKHLADRVRPTLNPIAETLGPSFPSGHSSWSAAFFAAAALLLARGRSRRTRAALAGLAAGLAVAVGATRVLLAVHWLSDVIAGLALGWAWFAVCAIAFGGRLLRFGATADAVGADSGRVAPGAPVSPPGS
jgi:membrane-associated phospholipid phosphatase